MLERHIMQAQARAMYAYERALNRESSGCQGYTRLRLPPGDAQDNRGIVISHRFKPLLRRFMPIEFKNLDSSSQRLELRN